MIMDPLQSGPPMRPRYEQSTFNELTISRTSQTKMFVILKTFC